ncbi:CAP domain-containing protein [Marinobacter sp.]|uniref:CAP domain-containing protein n=1 Tax=Marinobacter sp. TaxID=50741 RepID=UPI003566D586
MSTSSRLLFFVLSTVLIAGCGGGSGGGESSASAVSDSTERNRSAPEEPVTILVDGCEVQEYQAAMLEYVNAARSQGRQCGSEFFPAVEPLVYNCPVEGAASKHSNDMAQNNFFSHTGSDGLRVGDRVTETGYEWSVVGENIAAGFDDVESVMTGWLESPGHCRNIMDSRFTGVAVFRVDSRTADYPNYWTQVFDRPR